MIGAFVVPLKRISLEPDWPCPLIFDSTPGIHPARDRRFDRLNIAPGTPEQTAPGNAGDFGKRSTKNNQPDNGERMKI